MGNDDLTVEILKQIRDGITGVRDEVTGVRQEVRVVAERVDRMEKELGSRLDRVEHGLNDVGNFMRQIARDQSKHESFHGHHVELLEKDVDDLKTRVRALEERLENK